MSKALKKFPSTLKGFTDLIFPPTMLRNSGSSDPKNKDLHTYVLYISPLCLQVLLQTLPLITWWSDKEKLETDIEMALNPFGVLVRTKDVKPFQEQVSALRIAPVVKRRADSWAL